MFRFAVVAARLVAQQRASLRWVRLCGILCDRRRCEGGARRGTVYGRLRIPQLFPELFEVCSIRHAWGLGDIVVGVGGANKHIKIKAQKYQRMKI